MIATASGLLAAGFAHHRAGRLGDAVSDYRRALSLDPSSVDGWTLTGLATAGTLGDEAAVVPLRRGWVLAPARADAAANLANACVRAADRHARRNRPSPAAAAARAAILLDPGSAIGWARLGAALDGLRRIEPALDAGRRAVRLAPDLAGAWSVVSAAARRLGDPGMAGRTATRALALDPAVASGWTALGTLRLEEGAIPAARRFLERATSASPDHHWARVTWAQFLLMAGELEAGWREYEARLRVLPPRSDGVPPRPPWMGGDPRGRTLLIRVEQGVGDVVQFVRLIRHAKAAGARTVFECPPRLRRLLAGVEGVDHWIDGADGSEPHPSPADGPSGGSTGVRFDDCSEVSLLSLPHRLGLGLVEMGAPTPYLVAEPARVARWRDHLDATDDGSAGDHPRGDRPRGDRPAEGGRRRPRVGLVWRGSASGGRSAPFSSTFGPLAEVPGVRLIGLHRSVEGEAWGDVPSDFPIERLGDAFDAGADAFVDTAAVVSSLDLLISVDTASAHIAGALGRPVWLALTTPPNWRWFLERTDTPWYPRTRLFRQPRSGDWAAVGRSLAAALRGFARGAGSGEPALSGGVG